VRTGDQWDYLHEAAQLLRETGTMQGALAFSGPTAVCTQLLNWRPAMEGGLEEVRRLPAPLRLRAAIDRGWLPGLWLKADHDAAAAEPKPKRGLFAALAGKSRDSAPAAEFV
jgi:hypothetical protein